MTETEEGNAMLFKCLPPGAAIPGRFPGPAHARGKWFTVDIHCHVLTPKAAEMVAGHAAATRHPREEYANEHTRDVNRQQAERTRIQFASVEKRLDDMDRMGIDIQAISPSPNPDLLWRRARTRARHRARHQR
jgi:aminocarboxymuconate-semialdehyde decarboxylase